MDTITRSFQVMGHVLLATANRCDPGSLFEAVFLPA